VTGNNPGLRQALEDSLAADPDDIATHAAYADFLMQQDDLLDQARGEFIQVQLALEDESRPSAERERLRRRELELLEAHQREWLGELAPYLFNEIDPGPDTCEPSSVNSYTFRRGWLAALVVESMNRPFARALRHSPACRLLRELICEDMYDDLTELEPGDGMPEGAFGADSLWSLRGAPWLGTLRTFQFGEDQGDEYENYRGCWYSDALVPLVDEMARIEELYLYTRITNSAELFASPTFSRLRVLVLFHNSGVHRLQFLADNLAISHLTTLRIHPHHLERWHAEDGAEGYVSEQGYLPLRVVRPLLFTPHLVNLRHLCLRLSSLGDEGCEEIVRSGILKRLKVLDLRHGRITDAGVRILLACPEIRNLESLDLDRNSLSPEGIRRLKSLGIGVRCDSQIVEGERTGWGPRYLCEGEFE
jgi:uncharacterized protein (TIGR02996 family)